VWPEIGGGRGRSAFLREFGGMADLLPILIEVVGHDSTLVKTLGLNTKLGEFFLYVNLKNKC
jgi:hypothetical protein